MAAAAMDGVTAVDTKAEDVVTAKETAHQQSLHRQALVEAPFCNSPTRPSHTTVSFSPNSGQPPLVFGQSHNGFPDGIPKHFVLLDSDSTISIFNNASMLNDIHEVDTPLVLESNGGGRCVTSQMGSIKDFGKVWYDPNSIANILSLAEVRKTRRVTMDSNDDAAFHVHLLDGSGYSRFKEHESGLYLYDTTEGKTTYASATLTTQSSPTPISKPWQTTKRLLPNAKSAPPTRLASSTASWAAPAQPVFWTSYAKTSSLTAQSQSTMSTAPNTSMERMWHSLKERPRPAPPATTCQTNPLWRYHQTFWRTITKLPSVATYSTC
jgi:hypothetical protein